MLPGSKARRLLFAVALTAVLAVGVASIAGFVLSSRNPFDRFVRFHPAIAPEGGFYPTARQVRALAKAVLDPARTNVIVGGSSVMYGVGQPADLIWTRELASVLGDDYRVINLAMRGGDVAGIASFTAEMLTREGYRIVYVADLAVALTAQPIGSTPYQYFYWEARARGYLADHPARDRAIAANPLIAKPMLDDRLLAPLLLNINELRSYAAIRARKDAVDPEIDPPQDIRYGAPAANLALYIHLSGLQPEAQWPAVQSYFETAVPPSIRRSTIISVCLNSPGVADQAPDQARANWKTMELLTQQRVEAAGARAIGGCDGFTAADYVDRVHLSVEGGRKLAHRVAEAIRPKPAAPITETPGPLDPALASRR